MAAQKKTASKANKESEIPKGQILSSKRFRDRRDLVDAILFPYSETDTFTVNAVEEMVERYMKGQVK